MRAHICHSSYPDGAPDSAAQPALSNLNRHAPFAALFADPPRQLVRNHRPALGAQPAHQFNDPCVLLQRKRAAVQALAQSRHIQLQAGARSRTVPSLGRQARTSGYQGPFTSSGLSTFCQRCRHCTSDRSSKYSAAQGTTSCQLGEGATSVHPTRLALSTTALDS